MKGVCYHAWLGVFFVFYDLFIKVHGYMHAWIYVSLVIRCPGTPGSIRIPGTEVIGDCVPHDMGSRNQSQVLSKSSKHFPPLSISLSPEAAPNDLSRRMRNTYNEQCDQCTLLATDKTDATENIAKTKESKGQTHQFTYSYTYIFYELTIHDLIQFINPYS